MTVNKEPLNEPDKAGVACKPPNMLMIEESNLRAVCEWLNNDRMLMPQNEVRNCLKLINTAIPYKK